jgi:hypothetical protein
MTEIADDTQPHLIWAGKGSGAKQRIVVRSWGSDGRVRFVRTAGVPDHALNREQTCTEEQLRAAFECTGQFESMPGMAPEGV